MMAIVFHSEKER